MPVMRGAVAIGLCLVLQVGAAAAPFIHAHVGTGHHDQQNQIHAHLDGHAAHRHPPAGGREIATPDRDAHAGRVSAVPLFVAVDPDRVPVFESPQPPFAAHPPLLTMAHERVDAPRAHGPPVADRTTPRAPPAAFLI
jgi:hypothetical protein